MGPISKYYTYIHYYIDVHTAFSLLRYIIYSTPQCAFEMRTCSTHAPAESRECVHIVQLLRSDVLQLPHTCKHTHVQIILQLRSVRIRTISNVYFFEMY
mgnify:CR=1 FL=1